MPNQNYLMGGYDNATGKQLIAKTFNAATVNAANTAAIADADWVLLGINGANTRCIMIYDATIATAMDSATQTTLAAILADTATIDTNLAALAADLPAGTNIIGKVGIDQTTPGSTNAVQNIATLTYGTEANAWSAAAVGAGGTSTAIDTRYAGVVTCFGNSNAATTITVQVSQDNVAFYDSQVTQVLGGAGNFCVNAPIGARYIRLKSSGAATITATIAAKE